MLASLGLAKPAAAQKPTMVDPNTILFSIATIANDMAALDPIDGEPSDDDLVFHEDDWRQIEFFPLVRLAEIKGILTDYKAFEAAHRTANGWTRTFVRTLPAAPPVLAGADALANLERTLGVPAGPSAILFTSNEIQGRIRDGFTLQLGPGVALYGIANADIIPVLGANLRNGDDSLVSDAFVALHRAHDLILVDWQAQMLIEAVEANGQLRVWAP
jgi:hypothetical protein